MQNLKQLRDDLENSLTWIRGKVKIYVDDEDKCLQLINAQQRIAKSLIDLEKIERGLPAEDAESGEDITSIVQKWKEKYPDGNKTALQALKDFIERD